MKPNNAYKEAGVDIDAGDDLVEKIKPFAKATNRSGTMGGLGGFGALFDTKAAGYSDPILISSTDGVGTKIRVAIDANKHDTIGIDLVAMCVNDILVQGAEPLFFLDYFASAKLDVGTASCVIKGIAEGCKQAGCALIGGETAEMPSMYADRDYDLAGFTVGAVERQNIITGEHIKTGDVVLGLASSGIHSNGYALVRKIVGDMGVRYEDSCPIANDKSWGEVLLIPTKIYVKSLLPLLKKRNLIKGLAHITGGGLLENIPRILPNSTNVELDADKWLLPPIFKWLKNAASMNGHDLARTFNCGIGMIAITAKEDADSVMSALSSQGETIYQIGHVTDNTKQERIIINNTEKNW